MGMKTARSKRAPTPGCASENGSDLPRPGCGAEFHPDGIRGKSGAMGANSERRQATDRVTNEEDARAAKGTRAATRNRSRRSRSSPRPVALPSRGFLQKLSRKRSGSIRPERKEPGIRSRSWGHGKAASRRPRNSISRPGFPRSRFLDGGRSLPQRPRRRSSSHSRHSSPATTARTRRPRTTMSRRTETRSTVADGTQSRYGRFET